MAMTVAAPLIRRVAHDLRTPLATVVQSVELLLDARDEPNASALLQSVRRNVGWMAAMLDSQPQERETGHAEVDLLQAASDVHALMQSDLVARRQRLVILSYGRPPRVDADRVALVRALHNLVDNASKYGTKGDVLRIELRQRGARTLVTVHDHGAGVAPAERSAIFLPAYRTSAARESGVPGRGLGLAIARDLITACGGSIGLSRRASETRAWFVIRERAAGPAGARP